MAQIDAGLAVVSRYRFLEQGGDPANPAAGYEYLYCKADGFYYKDDAGNVIGPLGVLYTEGARVYNDATISIVTATDTALTFNQERYDNDSIHSIIVNTSRLTCKTAGEYKMNGHVSFAPDAIGWRQVSIDVNGVTRIASETKVPDGSIQCMFSISTEYPLAVNEYIELIVKQTKGSNLNVTSLANYSPEFSMRRVG